MSKQSKTRETWLQEATQLLVPLFADKGYTVPEVAVSCGFTSSGKRSAHVGECWSSSASKEKINQIFISPVLEDPVEVLDTLTHELVHAVDNCKHRHGPEFKEIALGIGLEGKMREASAGGELKQKLQTIARKLGRYPHTKLRVPVSMVIRPPRPKAKCSKCGYEVTPLKKWCHLGPPICPKDQVPMEALGAWELN